jgi:hypothetical protein
MHRHEKARFVSCSNKKTIYLVPPSAPVNLSADSIGATWVYVRWQHPSMASTSGISRYDILVMMNGNVSIQSTTTNQTYLNVTGLQPNVEYSFRVREVTTVHGDDIMGGDSDTYVAMTSMLRKYSFPQASL